MSVDAVQEIRTVDGRSRDSKRERVKGNMNVQTSNQVFHKAAIAKWVGNSLMCLRVVICSQQKHRSQLYLDLKCRVQFNLSYKKRSS